MISDLVITGFVQSLVLALVSYALMIPFRLLDFSDLTAEGAYPLGGAISASLCLAGFPLASALLLASVAAGLMGMMTGFICLRLKVNSLLAGIILSMMIYSVNLRILGQPNVPLLGTGFEQDLGYSIIFLGTLVMMSVGGLCIFLKTEWGLRMRAVGFNPGFIQKQKLSLARYTLLGLFLAGALTGLAGSMIVQLQSYVHVQMGTGMVIHGLAALMIGEKLVGKGTLKKQLMAPLLGALVYQQIQGMVLFLGLASCDLKFFTGALVLGIIALQKKDKRLSVI